MKSGLRPSHAAILTAHEGWFGSAAPEFQQAVLARCGRREVAAGQPIYRASDGQTDPCGIVEGSVDVYSRYGAGDNPMLHLTHEGSWIGYGAAIRGQPLRVTTVARTDVLLACIPWRAMQDLLRQRPEWWRFIALACLEYGDLAISGYADSLIPHNDLRCACTLLRIAGQEGGQSLCPAATPPPSPIPPSGPGRIPRRSGRPGHPRAGSA